MNIQNIVERCTQDETLELVRAAFECLTDEQQMEFLQGLDKNLKQEVALMVEDDDAEVDPLTD